MGWEMAMAPCFGCKRPFWFNTEWVPSILVDGVKQPVCRDCVERVNPTRVANGLAPIVPHADAYEPREAL
jgi:hypothetical protein